MAICELALFPAGIKAVNHFGERAICTTAGISSQAQIADGTGFQAINSID